MEAKKKRKYYFAWGIKRKDKYIVKSSIFIFLDWHWCGNNRNFPATSASKSDAKIFGTEDEAWRFWIKKGNKYPWFLEEWSVRRIRYWIDEPNNRKIMIGEKESQYRMITQKEAERERKRKKAKRYKARYGREVAPFENRC